MKAETTQRTNIDVETHSIDATLTTLRSMDQENQRAYIDQVCRRILKIDPNNSEAYRLRALAHFHGRDFKAAKRFVQRALKKDNKNFQAGIDHGRICRETGEYEQARICFYEVIQRSQKYDEAFARLGELEFSVFNNIDHGVTLTGHAVEIAPQNTEWRNWFARMLMSAGRYLEAAQHAYQVIEERPDWAIGWRNLGGALWLMGQLQESFDVYQEALKRNPDHDPSRENIVRILLEKNKHETAEQFIHDSLLNKDSGRLWAQLGEVRASRKDYEGALKAYNEALMRGNRSGVTLAGKGLAHSYLQQDRKADQALAEATRRFPKHPRPLLNYAVHKHQIGDTKTATQYAYKAAELAPNMPEVLYSLVNMHGKHVSTEIRNRLENAENLLGITPEQRVMVLYAKHNILHSEKYYDQAFEVLAKGAAIKSQLSSFNIKKMREAQDRLMACQSPNEIERFWGKGYKDPTPIFVIGTPRSGTTLLEQILGSHPVVSGIGERYDVGRVFKQTDKIGGIWYQGQEYVRAARVSGGENFEHLVDKMPGNFGFVTFIKLMLPKASIIHIRRHPMDSLLSCLRQRFSEGQEWSYDFDSLAGYYANYCQVMSYWRKILPEGSFIEIDYEDLVFNFDETVQKVFDYVGLSWDDRVERFYENASAVRTASMNQVRQPLYASSAGGWKKYAKHLKPLARKLKENGVELPQDVHDEYGL